MAENPNFTYASNTVQGRPYSVDTLVAEGSPYLVDNPNAVTTALLNRYIQREIIDTAPEPWLAALKYVFQNTPKDSPSLEYTWYEQGLGIAPVIALTTAAVQAAGAPGTVQTHTFTTTVATQDYLGLDTVVTYPDGTKGTVTAKTANSITISSQRGKGLPAVAIGDSFATGQGVLRGDSMDRIASVDRATQTAQSNYIQTIARYKRWGSDELQEWKNNQRVDYLERDMATLTRDLRFNMFSVFFNSTKGANVLSGTEDARTTNGIYQQMIAAGAATPTVPIAAAQATFEFLAFNTRFKGTGSTKALIARSEILHIFQQIYKETLTRYSPADKTIMLDLEAIVIGGQRYLLMPCDPFGDGGLFESAWRNRILCLDMDNISIRSFMGKPYMKVTPMIETDTIRQGDGSLRDYTYFGVEAKFGTQLEHGKGCFAMNLVL